MSHLHICVFGSPEVSHDEQLLSFSTRKEKALLLYLAVEGGKQTRTKLLDMFWPYSEREHGYAALRGAIMHLLNSVNRTHRSEEKAHLLVDRTIVELDPTSGVSLDISLPLHAWKLVQEQVRSSALCWIPEERQERNNLFEQALAQYRGEFLADFSLRDAPAFESWVRLQNQQWHMRMTQICETATHWYEMSGAMEQALLMAEHWLALDPLQEAVYRALMHLYLTQGNRTKALQVYDQCVTILQQELQTTPTVETRGLAKRIRALPSSRSPRLSSPVNPPIELPFVGREAEFNLLRQHYLLASEGQRQVVVIEGEGGIGKTRLATTFLNWAYLQGADVVMGQAIETRKQLPYHVFIEALRPRLDQENAPEDLLADVWLTELSCLFPELRERYPDLPPAQHDEGMGRVRLFEAVALLLSALAARAPMILFFDDLQWVDDVTLDLLTYLLHRNAAEPFPFFLLIAVQTGTPKMSEAGADWLIKLQRVLPVCSLSLASLNMQETSTTLVRFARHESDSMKRLGHWLFTQTQGHPLYLEELLKMLLTDEVVRWQSATSAYLKLEVVPNADAPWQALLQDPPISIRNHILQRFARLAEATQHLLFAGAILGSSFCWEQACAVADVDEETGIRAIEEALRSLLVRSTERTAQGVRQDDYVFAHNLIHRSISNEMENARRKLYHRRAFEQLLQHGTSAARLAHHASLAGLLEATFHYSVVVGDEALRVFATQQAISAYEKAWNLLYEDKESQELSSFVSAAQLQHLSLTLGRAYELLNQWEQARVVYQKLLTGAQALQEADMECQAMLCLAKLATEYSVDMQHFSATVQQAQQTDERIRLAENIQTNWHIGHLAQLAPSALLYGTRSLQHARDLNNSGLMMQSLNCIARAYVSTGQWNEGEIAYREVYTLALAERNSTMQVESLAHLAAASLYKGLPDEAIDNARQAYQMSVGMNNLWAQGRSAMFLVLGLLEHGDYEEALELALLHTEQARLLGHLGRLASALHILGTVFLALFCLKDAEETYREAAQINSLLKVKAYAELISAKLCVVYALKSEWTKACAYAQQAWEARGETTSKALLIVKLSHWYETEALLRGEEDEKAEEGVKLMEVYGRSSDRYRLPYLRSIALMEQKRGDVLQAVHSLCEAANLAERLHLPGELWQIQEHLGYVYQAYGDEKRASQAFIRAEHIVQQLAEGIHNTTLRTNFLQTPQIRHLLHQKSILQAYDV